MTDPDPQKKPEYTEQQKKMMALRQASKLPANTVGKKTIEDFFLSKKSNLIAMIPETSTLNADRMIKLAYGAMRTTPQLMECTLESLVGALVHCSDMGLEPNTPLGHAYLVPFWNSKKGCRDVQMIPGYRGLIDLALRSGAILKISSEAVYSNDVFVFSKGLNEKLEHTRTLEKDRGNIVAVYAVAHLANGSHQFSVMSIHEVNAIRDASPGSKKGPWKEYFEQMAVKTIIRRLFKLLPVSVETHKLVQLDGIADAGGNQHLESALTGEYEVIQDDFDTAGEIEVTLEPAEAEIQPAPAPDKPATTTFAQKPDKDASDQSKVYPEVFQDPTTKEMGYFDIAGTAFDLKKFQANEDGSPKIDENNKFIPRRTLRRSKKQ